MANTRKTRREEEQTDTSNAPTDASNFHNESLDAQVQELRNTVRCQNDILLHLQSRLDASAVNPSQRNDSALRIKSPPVTCYAGKPSDRTSEKVRSFFYSIVKFGALKNYDDQQIVACAECYLQDRAASWMMRKEKEGSKPTTLEGLKKAMIAKFVPANEKAKARLRLMAIKSHQSADLEEHIAKFEDMITLCDTPLNEAYIYFFNSLPLAYKAKFTEKFPNSQPLSSTGEPSIQAVYEYARTLDLSRKVSDLKKEDSSNNYDNGQKNKRNLRGRDKGTQRPQHKQGGKPKREWKDDSTVCWGPAQPGEGSIYRKYDRFCVCGLEGWSEPSHPCRKDNKGSKDKKDPDTKNE